MAKDKAVRSLKEKIYEKVCQFYDLLNHEELLIKNDNVVKGSMMQILQRMYNQQIALNNKTILLEDKEKFKKFLDANKVFQITEESFMFDLSCDMIQFLHSQKEMIPRFLVEILNGEKININKEKPMLGSIIHELGEYRDSSDKPVFSKEGLRSIFGVSMRNVLGHDKWWFDEQRRFCYEGEDPYTFEEFAGELVAVSVLIEALSTKYLQRFFQESLQEIQSENS